MSPTHYGAFLAPDWGLRCVSISMIPASVDYMNGIQRFISDSNSDFNKQSELFLVNFLGNSEYGAFSCYYKFEKA